MITREQSELNFKLTKERELITELTKELENAELSITAQKKEMKELKSQKRDVEERIKKSLAEVYAIENALKLSEQKGEY